MRVEGGWRRSRCGAGFFPFRLQLTAANPVAQFDVVDLFARYGEHGADVAQMFVGAAIPEILQLADDSGKAQVRVGVLGVGGKRGSGTRARRLEEAVSRMGSTESETVICLSPFGCPSGMF